MSDEDRRLVLDEVLMDELRTIREFVQELPAMKGDLVELKDDVIALKSDMKAVKAAITDLSHDLRAVAQTRQELDAHYRRLTRLEQPAA